MAVWTARNARAGDAGGVRLLDALGELLQYVLQFELVKNLQLSESTKIFLSNSMDEVVGELIAAEAFCVALVVSVRSRNELIHLRALGTGRTSRRFDAAI